MEVEGFWKDFHKQHMNQALCVSDIEDCPGCSNLVSRELLK